MQQVNSDPEGAKESQSQRGELQCVGRMVFDHIVHKF
jgi:hypothetical protein